MTLQNYLKLSYLSLVFAISSSCVVITIPESPQPINLIHEPACSGNLYGAGDEGMEAQKIVIESQEELEKLLDQMSTINPTNCSDILMTTDFDQYDLIFILDQVRGSAGYDVKITAVIKKEELVTVSYRLISPEGAAATVMTQPFCFQQVEKLKAEVRFELSE